MRSSLRKKSLSDDFMVLDRWHDIYREDLPLEVSIVRFFRFITEEHGADCSVFDEIDFCDCWAEGPNDDEDYNRRRLEYLMDKDD